MIIVYALRRVVVMLFITQRSPVWSQCRRSTATRIRRPDQGRRAVTLTTYCTHLVLRNSVAFYLSSQLIIVFALNDVVGLSISPWGSGIARNNWPTAEPIWWGGGGLIPLLTERISIFFQVLFLAFYTHFALWLVLTSYNIFL